MDLKRVEQGKTWVAALLASIATVTGGWIASTIPNPPLWLKFIVLAIFPIMSTIIVDTAVRAMKGSTRGRKFLAGPLWIEGCWFITTLDAPNDPNPIGPGLMYIQYGPPNLDLSVVVYRISSINGAPILTASESTIATFRDSDRQLMNVCMHRYRQQEEKALGVGSFLHESIREYPTRYEGWIIRISEGIYRTQLAERIPEEIIGRNQREFNSDWIVRTIEHMQHRHRGPAQVQTSGI